MLLNIIEIEDVSHFTTLINLKEKTIYYYYTNEFKDNQLINILNEYERHNPIAVCTCDTDIISTERVPSLIFYKNGDEICRLNMDYKRENIICLIDQIFKING